MGKTDLIHQVEAENETDRYVRKLGPQTKLPILCQVFDTYGDFKMRSFLFVSVALSSSVQAAASPGMWMLSAAQDPVLLMLPPSATCQKITLETKAPVSMVTWRSICFLPLHGVLRGGSPQAFFCQNKFGRIGLKEPQFQPYFLYQIPSETTRTAEDKQVQNVALHECPRN